MTSTASQQNPIPAPNSSASQAPSYASAAGASKKPTSAPLIATGSHPPPVVVGSTAPAAQNGKPHSASPANGRPAITPAIPAISGAPAVARGSSSVNGGSSHDRKGSVTISANAPSSHIANGGPVGGRTVPQFGYESPAIAHSTPQPGASVPMPIPGAGAGRIPSPAASPSPIPQPQQTGGGPRAPSNAQAQVTFGSFPGDNGDRLRQAPVPQNPAMMNQQHGRKDSQASAHGDMNHGGPGPNRGGYQGQGGRGRGNFNPQYGGNTMGFPPQPRFPGPNAGRGGMPSYQGRGGMQPFNSPRGSPAPAPALPSSQTPTMTPAVMATGQQFYPPPMYQQQIAPPFPPVNQYGQPIMMYPPYGQQGVPYMNAPPQSSPGFHQPPYGGSPYNPGPQGSTPMSRNPSQPSQVSEQRPTSSTGPSQAPVIAQGTPQPRPPQGQVMATPEQSQTFVRQPKKNAALVIKNSQGEVLDFTQVKAPASPAPSIQQSKTPPVIASTPTPPPKSSTPSHARSDSTAAANKSAEQRRNEFKDAVRKTTESPAEIKAKEEEAARVAAAEKAAAEKAKEEERLKEEARLEAEKKAEEEAKAAEEAKAKEKAEAEAKAKAEAEAEAKAAAEAAAAKEQAEQKPKDPAEMTDEEFDRMIREMEEEDARREAAQAELTAKKKVEQAEAKKRADADRQASAEENDRKLREQEAEMERLEEERERKRKENESKGGSESVADLLTKKIDDLKSDKKDSAPSTPNSVADKLSNLSINSADTSSTAGSKSSAAEKQRAKPAALKLAPIHTKPVEPPQPSAALQSLKSARFLTVLEPGIYPAGISSPNPALNAAVAKKGKTFKYDAQFLLQFQNVFTEQPSVEFHQQVKTLIGDMDGSRSASARTPGAGPGRQGSRAGAPAGFPSQGAMGQFGQAKTLPPGTTSEQRFAMSQGSLPRPGGLGNPINSFNRPGGFPGSSQMSRTPSSTNMGGIPNSPRQGSRSTRGGSKRTDYTAKAEAQLAKTMPLTAGMDVKPITVSASGWKPSSVGAKPGASAATVAADHLDPEMVQRKVKAALNKMTPEKFDKIADQILLIASQSKNEQDGRTLRQVIQLTFEKATDEAHWASMYAKFCRRMLETMSPEIRDENILDKNGNVVSGGALFRKYLLNRCQEEFERGWKVDLPEPKEGEDKKASEAALMSDEYYVAAAAKRRGLGLVQFIGELYKLGMLTERIMHECVRKLLEFQGVPDEAEIESLTKLLRTIGGNLDNTEKGKPMMEVYFQRINSIVDLPELPSRLKFMLMDVIDLRRVGWTSKDTNKGPKTLDEVRAEVEAQAAQKAAENARTSQRGGPGGRSQPGGRPGDRNFSYSQQSQNQVGMDDLRRLKGTVNRSSSQNISFGPTSMFSSRSNSGRRLAPGGSFGRAGEDSGASSRTGTPPTRERDSVAHTNAFGLLADTGENPASPPSTAASPALSKVAPDTSSNSADKKED